METLVLKALAVRAEGAYGVIQDLRRTVKLQEAEVRWTKDVHLKRELTMILGHTRAVLHRAESSYKAAQQILGISHAGLD